MLESPFDHAVVRRFAFADIEIRVLERSVSEQVSKFLRGTKLRSCVSLDLLRVKGRLADDRIHE